jgi:hypothetical protein
LQSNFCHTHPPAPGHRDAHLSYSRRSCRQFGYHAFGSGRPANTSHSRRIRRSATSGRLLPLKQLRRLYRSPRQPLAHGSRVFL